MIVLVLYYPDFKFCQKIPQVFFLGVQRSVRRPKIKPVEPVEFLVVVGGRDSSYF